MWSFDDVAIGQKADLKASSLKTRVIPRPPGLRQSDWYRHAANVCEQLRLQSTPSKTG